MVWFIVTGALGVLLIAALFIAQRAHLKHMALKEQFQVRFSQTLQQEQLISALQAEISNHKIEKAVLEERLQDMEARLKDHASSQMTLAQQAKLAMAEVGQQLSNQLLEAHEKQAEQLRVKQAASFQATSQHLHEEFQKITHSVAALEGKVRDSTQGIDMVKRALLSPNAVGNVAEITLENLFKAAGFESRRDYLMQLTLGDHREAKGMKLRPDAVLLLPGDHVLIVDSKASMFFMELAAGEEEGVDLILREKLKQRMRMHLKNLASKEYREAIKSDMQALGEKQVQHTVLVMFVPSDTALATIQRLDPELLSRAWEAEIFIAGPTGLMNILSHAQFMRLEVERAANHEKIMEEMKKLLASLSSLYDHAKRIGNGLQTAIAAYDKFAGSFNGTLLPRTKKLQQLGVTPPAGKALLTLSRYHMVESEALSLVEGEAIAVDTDIPLVTQEETV